MQSELLRKVKEQENKNFHCGQSRTGLDLKLTCQHAHTDPCHRIWALVASHALKLLDKQQAKLDVDTPSILYAM